MIIDISFFLFLQIWYLYISMKSLIKLLMGLDLDPSFLTSFSLNYDIIIFLSLLVYIINMCWKRSNDRDGTGYPIFS